MSDNRSSGSAPEPMEYFRVDPATGNLQSRQPEKPDKPQIQKPTAPNPAPPELIPDERDAYAVVTSPDVCRSPKVPIPYMSWGKADDKLSYSPNVRANGKIIKLQTSKFSCCYGDEPGVGKGVKSGTVGDVVEPVTSSTIVRANGQWVQRHTDRCTLNRGNAPGEYIYVKSTDIHKAPDGADAQDKTQNDKAQTDKARNEKIADYAKSRGWTRASNGGWNTSGGGWVSNAKVGEEMDYVTSGRGNVRPLSLGSGPSEIKAYTPSWTERIESSVQDGLMSLGMDKYQAGEYGRKVGTLAGFVPGVGNGLSADDAKRSFDAGQYLLGGVQAIGAVIGIGPGKPLAKGLEKGAEKLVQKEAEQAAAKALEEKAAKEAAEAAGKKEAEKEAVEAGEQGARISLKTRLKSLREKYLGKTPGKNSRTGKEVRERMRKEGTLRTNRRGKDEFLDEKGVWRPVDSPQTHMGHHPMDAVDYWNSTGRYHGAKSAEVRAWMLNSDNYRFEWGPLNSARGGASSSRYLPPTR
ncbi:PAAR-like domain-containing protein [Rhizobium sp. FKY42]|uniref:PAAR-like domain-containing protein n=1 Tax=Rhizobium sp. FKY42 TaxID=2562310 RepID=UPI0014859B7A|nr:PAAR-like domain-containing protein [Rhizobium sp. FKY42]